MAWIDGATTPTALGTLGSDYSQANAISADGTVIAGSSLVPDGDMHAVCGSFPPTPNPDLI